MNKYILITINIYTHLDPRAPLKNRNRPGNQLDIEILSTKKHKRKNNI